MEDELSLGELMLLFERSMERQQRLMKTVAAALGAEIKEDSPSRSSNGPRSPHLIDPAEGGEATPLFGEDEIADLPIGIGYSIIDNSE